MLRLTNPVTRALTLAAFLGAAALAGPATAASGTDAVAPAATPVSIQDHARMDPKDRVEMRIKELHSKLHISAAQEDQWGATAKAMRENAQSMDALIKERDANSKTMTAVGDLISYEKLAVAHEEGLKKLIPIFQVLYDSLSDDQKKSADDAFRSHGSHHRHSKG